MQTARVPPEPRNDPQNFMRTTIDGLPGFNLLKTADGRPYAIVSTHLFHRTEFKQLHQFQQDGLYDLDDAIELIILHDYHFYLEERAGKEPEYLEPALDVWKPTTSAGENFRVIMVAKGLLIAFNQWFVAAYSQRFATWYLNFVAAEPWRYVALHLENGMKYTMTLGWDGKTVLSTKIIRKNEIVPWVANGPNSKRHIFPPKPRVESLSEVRQLFLDEQLEIIAVTDMGRFKLVENPGGWAYKLVTCGNVSCSRYTPDMEQRAGSQELLVKKWELDFFV